jgi:hypothetical protein
VTEKEMMTKRYKLPLDILQLRSIRNSSSNIVVAVVVKIKKIIIIIGRTPKTDASS